MVCLLNDRQRYSPSAISITCHPAPGKLLGVGRLHRRQHRVLDHPLGRRHCPLLAWLCARGVYPDPLAAGALGNEKPIGITIEQWFSPDLGMIVSKTGRATTGGTSSYRLEHIVKGDPDPVLFTIPAEYTRQESAIASN